MIKVLFFSAQGTFPEGLRPAANSIVCTDNSALLSKIFNQTSAVERPIRFPPQVCRTAQSRCDQCLNQARCHALGMYSQSWYDQCLNQARCHALGMYSQSRRDQCLNQARCHALGMCSESTDC